MFTSKFSTRLTSFVGLRRCSLYHAYSTATPQALAQGTQTATHAPGLSQAPQHSSAFVEKSAFDAFMWSVAEELHREASLGAEITDERYAAR
jgi:hypothetical protein